jgi:hypothetical protein
VLPADENEDSIDERCVVRKLENPENFRRGFNIAVEGHPERGANSAGVLPI